MILMVVAEPAVSGMKVKRLRRKNNTMKRGRMEHSTAHIPATASERITRVESECIESNRLWNEQSHEDGVDSALNFTYSYYFIC